MRTPKDVQCYAGPLSDWLERFPKDQHHYQEMRWFAGQMRAWAYNWRNRILFANVLGKPVEEMADTYLYFAKSYRDGYQSRLKKLKGGAK